MTDKLREAAQAVLDRWDSLDWKAAPTADYMNRLRAALAAAPQPMGCGLPCGFDCNGACFDWAAAPQLASDREVEEAFLSLCEAIGVPATKFAAQEYRALAVTDRAALVQVIVQAMHGRVVGLHMAEAIADALIARGLRLPGGEETMAWAVVGEDGKTDPRKLWINIRDAEEYCERGERAVRVAIRVVEGGDDEQ